MAEDDRDMDAAERALGTLPREGEEPGDLRRRESWEARMAPLLDIVGEVPPPPGILERIEAQLDGEAAVVSLEAVRRRAERWRGLAAVFGTAAAGLALYLGLGTAPPEPSERYVAVVTADADGAPGMIVQIDASAGIATVIPVGIAAPDAHAFEMWQLPVGAEAPHSLGLLPAEPTVARRIEAGPGDIFAISLEPEGGSPTGTPTEPRYHGQLVEIHD